MKEKGAIKYLEELNTLYANGKLGYYKDFVSKTKEVIKLLEKNYYMMKGGKKGDNR